MTERTLINNARALDPFTSRPPRAKGSSIARLLSEDVVWVEKMPRAEFKVHEHPDCFYLIRSSETRVAGIVYVMHNIFGAQCDVHTYVLKAHRGHKLLYGPMREAILPHLLTRGFCQRSEASVVATIDRTQSTLPQAERMLRALGFRQCGERETVTQWEFRGAPHPTFRALDKWRSHSDEQVLQMIVDGVSACLQSIQLLRQLPEVNREKCEYLQEKAVHTYIDLNYAFQEADPDALPTPPEPAPRDYEATRSHCMRSITRLTKAATAVEMFSKREPPLPAELEPKTVANDLGWHGIRDVLHEADYARKFGER